MRLYMYLKKKKIAFKMSKYLKEEINK